MTNPTYFDSLFISGSQVNKDHKQYNIQQVKQCLVSTLEFNLSIFRGVPKEH